MALTVGSTLLRAGAEAHVSSTSDLARFALGYTWGQAGYGLGLTTGIAFSRLAFVNGVALMPLLLLCGYFFWQRARATPTVLFSVSPALLTVLEVVVMRNYFAVHPWMASPLLLVGLIFTMAIAQRRLPFSLARAVLPGEWRTFAKGLGVLFICVLYSITVISLYRTNERNIFALVSLIRLNTGRSDTVFVSSGRDPRIATEAKRLSEAFDRHIVIVKDLDLASMPAGAVVLSQKSQDIIGSEAKLTFVNQTFPKAGAGSWVIGLTRWFNSSVARRSPGDRMDIGEQYFLYRVAPLK